MNYPALVRGKGSSHGAVFVTPAEASFKGPSWDRKPQRGFLMGFSLGVLLYSLAVLLTVAWMGDTGIRCIFGNKVTEKVSDDYQWSVIPPVPDDEILAIGSRQVANYPDYIKALRALSRQ